MEYTIHRANTRGHANHGWLDTHHTFSFASYHNPERMSFGVLRVLNDDVIAPGTGFGRHPHANMEIVSIPLSGALQHQDSIGSKHVIREREIQVMSAGSGIEHSEKNDSHTDSCNFLQIWVIPNKENVPPRYDQQPIPKETNQWNQIVSPNRDDAGVWLHQDAWFSVGEWSEGRSSSYAVNKKENGVYVFVLSGKIEINGEQLSAKDGMGVWETDTIDFQFSEKSRVLLLEVPMRLPV